MLTWMTPKPEPALSGACWALLGVGGRLACLGGSDSGRDPRTQPSAQDKERLPNVGKKIHRRE